MEHMYREYNQSYLHSEYLNHVICHSCVMSLETSLSAPPLHVWPLPISDYLRKSLKWFLTQVQVLLNSLDLFNLLL